MFLFCAKGNNEPFLKTKAVHAKSMPVCSKKKKKEPSEREAKLATFGASF